MARPAAQDLLESPRRIQGNHAVNKMRDNRIGRIGPTSLQRRGRELGARVRWNAFGTPEMLASTGKPLAQGLPADPVAAAGRTSRPTATSWD